MLASAALLLLANMSIEPIITVYVGTLHAFTGVVLTAGIVMAASAFGSILAAPRLGRLADRVGTWPIIIACLLVTGALLIPQAFVTESWQMIGLRFLMGMSLAGLMPCINATIRHSVPDGVVGTILGYCTSAQYAGQVIGPVIGGFIGRPFWDAAPSSSLRSVLVFLGALYIWLTARAVGTRR